MQVTAGAAQGPKGGVVAGRRARQPGPGPDPVQTDVAVAPPPGAGGPPPGAGPEEAIGNPQGDPEPSPAEVAAIMGAQIGQRSMAAHQQVDGQMQQMGQALMMQAQEAHQMIDMAAKKDIQAMQEAVVQGAQMGSEVASGPQGIGPDAV